MLENFMGAEEKSLAQNSVAQKSTSVAARDCGVLKTVVELMLANIYLPTSLSALSSPLC